MSPKVMFAVFEVVVEAKHVDRAHPTPDELVEAAEALGDVGMLDKLQDCAREALYNAGLSGKLAVRVTHV